MSYDLIKPSDPQYFTQTSDDPYDRHKYKVISKTGDEVTVDDWESAQLIWWNSMSFLSHIEVI